MISINLISWNRLDLLTLTLKSITCSLRSVCLPYEIIVFDQGSNNRTRLFLRENRHLFKKIIFSDSNIGIAEAWKVLLENSSGDFILPLENDWFCDTSNHKWILDSLDILQKNPDIAFVKLRSLRDFDNYGWGHIEHAPWSVASRNESYLYYQHITTAHYSFYKVCPQYISFTFNPILIRSNYLRSIHQFYRDDPANKTVLRSGEDLFSIMWRQEESLFAATLLNGPFRHTGLYNRLANLFALPFYKLKVHLRSFIYG